MTNRFGKILLYREGESGGAGAGSGDGNGNGNAGKEENKTPEGGGGTGTNTGATGTGSGEPEKKFTQAELDRIIADRLAQANRVKDGEIQKLKDEQERLKDEGAGEWKKLYETEKTRTADLTTKLSEAEALAAHVHELIDQEISTWPDEVKANDPGKDNHQTRTQWLKSMRPIVTKLKGTGTAPEGEHGAGNEAGGSGEGDGGKKPTTIAAMLDRRYVNPSKKE